MKNKQYILGALFLFTLFAAQGQAEVVETSSKPLTVLLGDMVMYIGLAVGLVAILAIAYVNNMAMQMQKMKLLEKHGIEVMEKTGLLQQESWWKRQYKRWTNVVPVEKEADVMLDHDYDGIKELDNSLPPWWVAMFYITIAFGVVYFVYTHFTDYGKSSSEKYAIEMEQAEEAKEAYRASQANSVDETNADMIEDVALIAEGESMFKAKCAACHGQSGEGGVGPNLTDQYWIHGGDIKDVFKTIKYGVPEKGMIAWQTQLPPSDIHKISSFIMTLVGTNPPNQKEPQGELHQANGADEESEPKQLGMK